MRTSDVAEEMMSRRYLLLPSSKEFVMAPQI